MHSFIFTGPNRTISTHGIATLWPDVSHAEAAATLVVGALPFHRHDQPRLFSPAAYSITNGPITLPTTPLPAVTDVEYLPPLSCHLNTIKNSIAEIHTGLVDKIVVSRAERYQLAGPVPPQSMLARFMDSAGTGCGYLVEVATGEFFIGPSPEILVRKHGNNVFSFPLAGTAPRCSDPVADRLTAKRLQDSVKDRKEHRFVTEGIKAVLAPLCSELEVPAQPELLQTAHTWHLGTRISGKLRDTSISSMALAHQLHPTAAVNGYPAAQAARILADREPHRGFYSGAVGWNLPNGDGEWRVAIRSALVRSTEVIAFAGGGIVADSDPKNELEETCTKLAVVRNVLGLDNVNAISC